MAKTKAEIQAELDTLQEAHHMLTGVAEELQVALDESGDEVAHYKQVAADAGEQMATLQAAYAELQRVEEAVTADANDLDNEVTELKVAVADLKTALQAVPPAPTAPPETPIGVISVPGGILALASTEVIHRSWISQSIRRGKLAVDYKGPHADHLVHMAKDPAHTATLPDGTVRILCADVPRAQTLQDRAKRYLAAQEDGAKTTVLMGYMESHVLQCEDATRDQGAGIVNVMGEALMGAVAVSGSVKMSATKDAGGKLVALHIRF